jgi:hypothetical protein
MDLNLKNRLLRMDINHLTIEELKIVQDVINQRINELNPYPSKQKALEDSKLALRKYILENKEKVAKDLEEMRDKSIKNEQETLEEVAERIYREYPSNPKDKPDWHYNKDIHCFKKRKAFVNGAKYMSERMHSDEEVIELLQSFNDVCNLTNEPHQIKNFFYRFKKL